MYGAENSTLQAMTHTPGTVEAVAVFSNNLFHTPLAEKTAQLGYPSRILPNQFKLFFKALFALDNFLSTFKPEIIHSHGYKELFFGVYFANKYQTKLIHTNHGFVDNKKIKKKFYHFLEMSLCKILKSLPVIVLAISTWKRFADFGIPKSRIYLIRNSIYPDKLPKDVSIPTDLENDFNKKKVVVYIGRLSHEKGPDLLLRAMPKVVEAHKDALLMLAGDGYLKPELRAWVSDAGLKDQIRFLGYRRDAKAIMACSKAVVISSRMEAIPRTLMESMLLGKKVVATSVGGIPDVVSHGKNGILTIPENIQDLSKGIIRALDDRTMDRNMGLKARSRILKDFNAEVRCRELAALYKKLIHDRSCPKQVLKNQPTEC